MCVRHYEQFLDLSTLYTKGPAVVRSISPIAACIYVRVKNNEDAPTRDAQKTEILASRRLEKGVKIQKLGSRVTNRARGLTYWLTCRDKL